ncbi:MAG: iron-sulfur cluster assembly scaffold protein [Planctomycetes bacterium]|nr:iron-sulfur cluster assembly scaffold protein [Planctomycetota bacterium]
MLAQLAELPCAGSLDEDSPTVGTAVVCQDDCGNVIKIQIDAGPDGRIREAAFKTFGCAHAIAAASLAAEWLGGRTVAEAEKLRGETIARRLDMPAEKFHCAALAERAVRAAVRNWRTKQAGQTAATPVDDQPPA